MGVRLESWQLCLSEYQRAEYGCIPRQKAFVFFYMIIYMCIRIICVAYMCIHCIHCMGGKVRFLIMGKGKMEKRLNMKHFMGLRSECWQRVKDGKVLNMKMHLATKGLRRWPTTNCQDVKQLFSIKLFKKLNQFHCCSFDEMN